MLRIRKSDERGVADFGWLKGRHSFSFGHFHDPEHMGFRSLRVINDDLIEPGKGFGTHPHQDMEIISYVVDGLLEHKDSMGNGSVLRRGDVQRMTAGTGVKHSEFNGSTTELVHLLQVWIEPEQMGLEPSYEEKYFSNKDKQNVFRLIGSRDGRDGSLAIHQDADLYASVLEPGKKVRQSLRTARHIWVQIIAGKVNVNNTELTTGDGAAIVDADGLSLDAIEPTELLVFDLA